MDVASAWAVALNEAMIAGFITAMNASMKAATASARRW